MQVVLGYGRFFSRRLILAAGFSPAASRWLKRFAFLSTRLERFMMRAFGSYQTKLPAGFLNAGDLTLVSKLAEADTANAEFAEIAVRSTTNLAAVVFSCGEFLFSLLLNFHRSLCHDSYLL
jgi:hypothetical protein